MMEAEDVSQNVLGKVIQSEHNPLVMSADRRRLRAFVTEKLKESVSEGSYLVAEKSDGSERVLCRVQKIESYPQHSSIAFTAINEFVTRVDLEPLAHLNGSSFSRVLNGNFDGYCLRKATPDELKRWHGIPKEGIDCGELLLDSDPSGVPFHLPEESLFRSLFICGAKGCGKTTCLKYLLPRLISNPPQGIAPPAIVILDVEGEFTSPETQSLFAEAGGSLLVQKLSTDTSLATATLSLSQIHYEQFVYFAPNLPLNTALHLESICKTLFALYAERGISRPGAKMLEDIRNAAWRQPGIHVSQQQAIIRTTMSPIFSLFDQDQLPPLMPEDLVRPGRVSLIDVSSLTDDQQRTVALYLLSVFARYKDRTQDSTGLLLVMDEAQKLFPHKGDLKQEYAKRLSKFVGHIVHRGRRRRYGILLSTQYPADVSREVVELCDSKFVFRMSGPQEWLRAILGSSEHARMASELRIGEAFVVSNSMNLQEPVAVRFPNPMEASPKPLRSGCEQEVRR